MIGQQYIKDEKSGALLNINTKELEERKYRRKQDKQLKEHEERITKLEAHVLELTVSVRTLLEKLSVISS
jgi:hypothetical protein